LDHEERAQPAHAAWLALHRDLLALRRAWRTDKAAGPTEPYDVDGAVLADQAFCLRFFRPDARRGATADERLLIVNLGPALDLSPAPEPLLAPPLGLRWSLCLATDDPRYGGFGTPEPETDDGWRIPAESAVVLAPTSDRGPRPGPPIAAPPTTTTPPTSTTAPSTPPSPTNPAPPASTTAPPTPPTSPTPTTVPTPPTAPP